MTGLKGTDEKKRKKENEVPISRSMEEEDDWKPTCTAVPF
jgi:hypothetical protein